MSKGHRSRPVGPLAPDLSSYRAVVPFPVFWKSLKWRLRTPSVILRAKATRFLFALGRGQGLLITGHIGEVHDASSVTGVLVQRIVAGLPCMKMLSRPIRVCTVCVFAHDLVAFGDLDWLSVGRGTGDLELTHSLLQLKPYLSCPGQVQPTPFLWFYFVFVFKDVQRMKFHNLIGAIPALGNLNFDLN